MLSPSFPLAAIASQQKKADLSLALLQELMWKLSSERRADFVLQPGNVAQTVEVQGEEMPLVESSSNTLGGIVEAKIAAIFR